MKTRRLNLNIKILTSVFFVASQSIVLAAPVLATSIKINKPVQLVELKTISNTNQAILNNISTLATQDNNLDSINTIRSLDQDIIDLTALKALPNSNTAANLQAMAKITSSIATQTAKLSANALKDNDASLVSQVSKLETNLGISASNVADNQNLNLLNNRPSLVSNGISATSGNSTLVTTEASISSSNKLGAATDSLVTGNVGSSTIAETLPTTNSRLTINSNPSTVENSSTNAGSWISIAKPGNK